MNYKLISKVIQNPVTEVLRTAIPSRVAAVKLTENMIGTMLAKYPMVMVNKTSNGVTFIFDTYRVEVAIEPDPEPEPIDTQEKAD